MLQVIQRKFEKLEEAIKYINNISILYGYLKDYKIINGIDTYILLLNFDVQECKLLLELANLKQITSEDNLIYRTSYNIELEDKSRKPFSIIDFRDFKNGFEIQGYFDCDGTFSLIRVEYDVLKDVFIVELRNFQYSTLGWNTIVEERMLLSEVDHKIIYNHLVKLIFNRGYLANIKGLNNLEESLYYIARWLNRKEFDIK